MKTVTLDVRFELVDDELAAVWWADSPDVAGFYASSQSMESLRAQVGAALDEVLDEPYVIVERLVSPPTVVRVPSLAA